MSRGADHSGANPIRALPFDGERVRQPDTREALSALGQRLRERGLRERAVRACFDLVAIAHLPLRLAAWRRREPQLTPAGALPWLLVAGRELPEPAVAAALGDDLAYMLDLGLIERVEPNTGRGDSGDDRRIRARVALIPVGDSLMACEPVDSPPRAALVVFPDESAFHVIGALPRRRVARWLDVGTGCAVAPLAARGRAETVVGADINPRALAFAELGAALSGAAIRLCEADLFAGIAGGPWQLITFNAPIPAEVAATSNDRRLADLTAGDNAPLYYRSPPGAAIIERFWAQARVHLAPGGEVLVHSWQPVRDYPASLGLPGRVAVARYTPDREDIAYGITAWRPDGPDRVTFTERRLSVDAPFVTRDWGLDD